jgi:hypothetical protein
MSDFGSRFLEWKTIPGPEDLGHRCPRTLIEVYGFVSWQDVVASLPAFASIRATGKYKAEDAAVRAAFEERLTGIPVDPMTYLGRQKTDGGS